MRSTSGDNQKVCIFFLNNGSCSYKLLNYYVPTHLPQDQIPFYLYIKVLLQTGSLFSTSVIFNMHQQFPKERWDISVRVSYKWTLKGVLVTEGSA